MHNANRQLGTPEDLSCFTPSPVASSPIVPSPDLRHFQSPKLLSNSIVSPSEQILLVPSPRSLSPGFPIHKVPLDYSESVRAVVDGSPHGRIVTWDVYFMQSYIPIICAGLTFPRLERFKSDLLYSASRLNESESSLSALVSCLDKYAHTQEVGGSRVWRSALLKFVLSQPISADFGKYSELSCLNRLEKLTFTHSGIDIFGHFKIVPGWEPGSLGGIHLSVLAIKCKQLLEVSRSVTLDLEQKHNRRLRRSESCETIESTNSFRTDSVVDWGELLYGYNQEAALRASVEA